MIKHILIFIKSTILVNMIIPNDRGLIDERVDMWFARFGLTVQKIRPFEVRLTMVKRWSNCLIRFGAID